MKPTAQAIVWEVYGEAPPVAAVRKAFSPMVRQTIAAQESNLPAQMEMLKGWVSQGVVNPPHLWEAQEPSSWRAAQEPWEHSSLWNSTLPRAPSVRSGMQMNRRWHSWSRSPSAAVLKPLASTSLKSNKSLTSSLHISKSNKTFPSKQY